MIALHPMDRVIQMKACVRLQELLGDDAKALPFLLSCFTAERHVSTAKQLCPPGASVSSWISRFTRLDLPGPTTYLRHARLIRLRAICDDPSASMNTAIDALGWSYSAHFQRHIRDRFRCSAGEWRAAFSTADLLNRYCDGLITPYVDTLRTFDPALTLTANARVRGTKREVAA